MKQVTADERQLYTKVEKKNLADTLLYLTLLFYRVRYRKVWVNCKGYK